MTPQYYQDPYCIELETMVSHHVLENDFLWVSLEKSIIYPGGGGQARDKAFINGAEVRAVKKAGSNVMYAVDSTLKLAIWNPVKLQIDKAFRLYNMQQHSGQHLMSAVFDDKGYKTVSAHLGEEYTAIEVSSGTPSQTELMSLEQRCNDLIRSALPIKSYFVDKVAARKLPLRKPAGDLKQIRIVQIGTVDYSACAGTHVSNSAEIGLIKIIGMENIRGHVRIKAKIGRAAMEYIAQLQQSVSALQHILDVPADVMPTIIQKHLDEKSALHKENKKLQLALAAAQAAKLNADHPEGIIAAEINDPKQARQISSLLSQTYRRDAFLLAENRFFFSRATGSDFDFGTFMKSMGADFGMRGGGPEDFVQGVFDIKSAKTLLQALSNFYSA